VRPSRWGRRLTRSQREDLNGRLLVAPTALVVVLVVILPFLAVILFSVAHIRLIDIPRLTLNNITFTTDNFAHALSSQSFWSGFGTTIAYASLTTIGAIVGGLAVGLALRRPFRGRGLIRAGLLIPYVLPVVAAAAIWKTLLNPQYGVVNALGKTILGWDAPIAFLSTTSQTFAGVHVPVTLFTVVAFEIWKTTPLAFLFITARLQVMPAEPEEAAALDGANSRQVFWHIIFPQLRGVVILLVLLRFIWSFQSFNDIYLLTGGAGGTQVLAIRIYTELITRADIGSAAAYGLVMTAILAVLLSFVVIVNRRGERL